MPQAAVGGWDGGDMAGSLLVVLALLGVEAGFGTGEAGGAKGPGKLRLVLGDPR